MRIPHTDAGVPYIGVLAAGLLVVGVAVTAARFQPPSTPAMSSATALASVPEGERKTNTARVTAQFQAPAPTAPAPISAAAVHEVDLKTITASVPVAATATTSLYVRSGPGSQFDVLGLISTNDRMMVTGCIEASRWCSVDAGGVQGWAYSQYLATNQTGARLIVGDNKATLGIPVVTFSAAGSARPR